MSLLQGILKNEAAQWILSKIDTLEGREKHCAANSIRFLKWSDEMLYMAPPVSSFCAMHATEEAVASFISAAKRHGHRAKAKEINLHDHLSKTLVSLLAQRLSNLAANNSIGVAVKKESDCLAFCLRTENLDHFGDLHLGTFTLRENQKEGIEEGILLGEMPSLEDLKEEVEKGANARNILIYATDTGCPPGFVDPSAALVRETKLSLGLIWAAIDIALSGNAEIPFVNDILDRMTAFNSARKKSQSPK